MVNSSNKQNSVVQNITRKDDAIIMELTGDVDLHQAAALRNNILEIMQQKPPVTIINLSEVPFMDSSGLATLVEALQLSRRFGGKLKLVGIHKRVRSIFEIARLDTIFELYESEAEALAE